MVGGCYVHSPRQHLILKLLLVQLFMQLLLHTRSLLTKQQLQNVIYFDESLFHATNSCTYVNVNSVDCMVHPPTHP